MSAPKKKTPPAKTEAAVSAVKKDSRTYFYAVGKRKTSIAKVKLYPQGKGAMAVNGRKAEEYFFGPLLEKIISPLKLVGMATTYDVEVNVSGGGINGQADAISHGIARALTHAEEGLKTTVKRAGMLTRDSRVKERKKYGLKKARRAPQWSKR